MQFPLPLGAWDRLCYFIVALPEPLYNYFEFFVSLNGPLSGKRITTVLELIKGYNFDEAKKCWLSLIFRNYPFIHKNRCWVICLYLHVTYENLKD